MGEPAKTTTRIEAPLIWPKQIAAHGWTNVALIKLVNILAT